MFCKPKAKQENMETRSEKTEDRGDSLTMREVRQMPAQVSVHPEVVGGLETWSMQDPAGEPVVGE